MPDRNGAAARHWLLPQEAGYRRWTARMLAWRTGPNPQRTAFEKLYGPDGAGVPRRRADHPPQKDSAIRLTTL